MKTRNITIASLMLFVLSVGLLVLPKTPALGYGKGVVTIYGYATTSIKLGLNIGYVKGSASKVVIVGGGGTRVAPSICRITGRYQVNVPDDASYTITVYDVYGRSRIANIYIPVRLWYKPSTFQYRQDINIQ